MHLALEPNPIWSTNLAMASDHLNLLHRSPTFLKNRGDAAERDNPANIEQMFTTCVDILRKVETTDLQDMAKDAWDVVHHRHVLTAIHHQVPTLSLIILKGPQDALQNVILIPVNWGTLMSEDSTRQLGAVTFVCSQAVDAYNEINVDTIANRAASYEGVFLRDAHPRLPDKWQIEAMGTPVPSTFAYERRRVAPAAP